jgi:hypothetical protein
MTVQTSQSGRNKWFANLFLILAIAMVSLVIHHQFLGVKAVGDAGRYLGGAAKITQGIPLNTIQIKYAGYIYFIHLVTQMGGSTQTLVLVQCLLSVLSALAMYQAGRLAFAAPVGLTAALCYLCIPDIQRWNFYVLADGPANSLLLLSLSLVIICTYKPWYWLAMVPIMAWYVSIRPESPFLLFFVSGLFITDSKSNRMIAALVIIGITFWLFFTKSGDSSILIANWDKGTVIWGYLYSPPPEVLKHAAGSGLNGVILDYLIKYPYWMIKILVYKAFWLYWHARPCYSLLHNIYIVGQSLILLLFSFAGLRWYGIRNSAVAMIGSLIILQTTAICFSFADWDGRHLTRIIGPMILLASAGGWQVLRCYTPGLTKQVKS